MHLKELTHRSPLRLFERSVQGGLGPGNLGVVVARAGVGKSAFLTYLALDDLLRDRRVLHVTTTQTVDHVRNFYDEMFADLARAAHLEETVLVRDKIDKHRIITSVNGGELDPALLESTVDSFRRNVDFVPDVIIVDGPDFKTVPIPKVAALRDLARRTNAELWISMNIPRPPSEQDWHDLPAPVARLEELVSVCVLLQPVADAIRIRLLKDHGSKDVPELSLDLDPRTYLVKAS